VDRIKYSWSTLPFRSTRTATFTIVKTPRRSSAVVPPSAATAPTKVINRWLIDKGHLEPHFPSSRAVVHRTNLIPNSLPRRHITSHTVLIAEFGMRFSIKRVGRSAPQSSAILAPVSDTSISWHSRLMKEPSTVIHAEIERRRRRASRASFLDIPQVSGKT
jgi:hypothetical protein